MSQAAVAPDAPGETAAPKGSKKKLMIIAAAVVVVAGGGAAWFLMKPSATSADKAKHTHAIKLPALYSPMEPPFVVNFQTGGQARFLQLAVQVMTREPHVVEVLKSNDPAIRNDLLLMYGTQTIESVNNLEGKERLRAATLDAVRKVVAAEGGKPESVEAVYFTSFVMQ
jgi:flagellar FliL protein